MRIRLCLQIFFYFYVFQMAISKLSTHLGQLLFLFYFIFLKKIQIYSDKL